MPDYPCEFTLIGTHNHDIDPEGPSTIYPLNDEIVEEFHKHWLANLNPGEALHKHIMKLLADKENSLRIQDTRYRPTIRQVYNLWDKWQGGHYGTGWPSALEKIKYNYPSDALVRICEEKNVVVIVTELMQRVHKLNPQAKEVIFIDSTSNIDMYHTTVTFILTASPIGAMPLGVILSDGQDQDSYTKGFELLKEMTDGFGFFGNQYPEVFYDR